MGFAALAGGGGGQSADLSSSSAITQGDFGAGNTIFQPVSIGSGSARSDDSTGDRYLPLVLGGAVVVFALLYFLRK